MNLVDAQREVREVFIGGFPGQFISGLAAVGFTWCLGFLAGGDVDPCAGWHIHFLRA